MKRAKVLNASVVISALFLPSLLLNGCDKESENAANNAVTEPPATGNAAAKEMEKIELVHVHGLSYSADGSKLMIPSHYGLAIFDGATWSKAPGPEHDYMGFAATKEAIYSSGHPAQGSGLVNPFGLIKSTDGGQTWQKLGMEGESDFHMLAASYGTNAVYVVNFHPNSKMKEEGIYYTVNNGFSWEKAAAKGLDVFPRVLAVHPSNPKTIAAGLEKGLFLSQDAGDTFQKIADGEIAGAYFNLDGKYLWYSTADAQPELVRFNLESRQAEKMPLPELKEDAVAYIAQNPEKQNEYAIATFKRSVYVSPDAGTTWKQIAKQGHPI